MSLRGSYIRHIVTTQQPTGQENKVQYAFLGIAIFMILVLAIRCFFVKPSRIDEGNGDIYGPDFISIDDEREGKY